MKNSRILIASAIALSVLATTVYAQDQPVGSHAIVQNPNGRPRATASVNAPRPAETFDPQKGEGINEENADLIDFEEDDPFEAEVGNNAGEDGGVKDGSEDDSLSPPPLDSVSQESASATQPPATKPGTRHPATTKTAVTQTRTQQPAATPPHAQPPIASPPANPAPAYPAPAYPAPVEPLPAYPVPANPAPLYPAPAPANPAPAPVHPVPANPVPVDPAPANPAPARPPTGNPPTAVNPAPVPAKPTSVPSANLPPSPAITSAYAVPTGVEEDFDPEADMDDGAMQEVVPNFPPAVLPESTGVLFDGPLFQTANPTLGGFPGMSSSIAPAPPLTATAVSSAALPGPVTLKEVTASVEGSAPSSQPHSAASKLSSASFSVAALTLAGVLLL